VGSELFLKCDFHFGATAVPIVCVIILLSYSNLKASGISVPVHEIFLAGVLDFKQICNNKRNFNINKKYLNS